MHFPGVELYKITQWCIFQGDELYKITQWCIFQGGELYKITQWCIFQRGELYKITQWCIFQGGELYNITQWCIFQAGELYKITQKLPLRAGKGERYIAMCSDFGPSLSHTRDHTITPTQRWRASLPGRRKSPRPGLTSTQERPNSATSRSFRNWGDSFGSRGQS